MTSARGHKHQTGSVLASDLQIPAWRGEDSASDGDLAIPFEQGTGDSLDYLND
jgi:hypothetical protein